MSGVLRRFVLGLPQLLAWIYVFSRDWRIALAAFVIMWGNNVELMNRGRS